MEDLECRDGLATIKAFLEAHGDSRFAPWSEHDAPPTGERVGFRRQQADGLYFYVLPQAFRLQLCQGYAPQRLLQALAQRGWLSCPTPGRFTHKVRLPGLGDKPTNVYLLTPAVWS